MKERQSNIELLRIVSMLFIVLEHILIMGTDFFSVPSGNQLLVANSIIGFTYVGVNCFILITGYFGADFSWKRLLSLYLICAFYELVGFLIVYSQGDVAWSTTALSYIIFPLSHSSVWFIRCYVILLLLLPIINAGLNNLDKKGYLYVLLLLTILNLYFGWFHKQQNFNGDGYNASQMVYVYVIGRYLNQYVDWEKLRTYRGYILLAWFLLSVCWGIIQTINNNIHVVPHWNGWAYNNPVILASSIALFMVFGSMEIKSSRVIHTLAAGMFSVLLIHLNRYMGKYLYDGVRSLIYSPILSQSIWLQIVALILVAIMVLVGVAVIDMPRAKVHKWLMNKFEKVLSHTHTHTHKWHE